MAMSVANTLKRHSFHASLGLVIDNPRLLIVEHYETVREQIDVLLRSAKGLLGLVKKRISLEKDRVKSLGKLSSSILDDCKFISFEGVLKESWDHIKQHSLQEGMYRSKMVTELEEKVVQPLSVFLLSDLEKRFQTINAEVNHKVKDYQQVRLQTQKAKERYFSLAAEWEGSLMMIHKEYGAVWEPVAGNKLYEKEQQICRKVDEARLDYESCVEKLNANVQELTLQHLPQALLSLQDTTEQMVSVVHTALKSFETLQLSLLGKIETELSSACRDYFIVPDFCQSYFFKNFDIESPPLPPSFDFDEYSYKDGALEVQARKTQYRAMSLLSPSELASRGAMFLGVSSLTGGGGKGKGNGPVPAIKIEGLNPFLVEVCVEYLNQPNALKEEGIFRVPGETSTIRSLHADFKTAGQDKDKLKSLVMEQYDPNNISGLLKLHLRENHLISSKVMANISELLSRPTTEGAPPLIEEITANCTNQELRLLSLVVELMSNISGEPENKMNARTLGIACGLSLFPQLDPGQATRLLEYLIKNRDQLSVAESAPDQTGSDDSSSSSSAPLSESI
ncbi:PREDICTED: uncharacterized protein LOC100638759 [Amphimedon queenslandica]|uniref:Rho-GAP domain-containing protein n=1 Tax=Amphimedon queenslandica TaxID=400682 RepID=A0A1X7VII4_AMPQE|nr:PREDICTED: uncharacterized protein LOC100638759 [Amphimedon queenslandica]|eukprot:XP_003384235.2 PREDICTED: uncharacterized protein LOC100638759 [Amphimedon queenslandica]